MNLSTMGKPSYNLGPKVISYVFVVYLSLFSSSLPPFNVVLFENCYSFTSIFNIEMRGGGGGGVI